MVFKLNPILKISPLSGSIFGWAEYPFLTYPKSLKPFYLMVFYYIS